MAEADASKLQNALAALDRIAEKDKKLTGPDQIERLTKPSAKYLNLNPFEVSATAARKPAAYGLQRDRTREGAEGGGRNGIGIGLCASTLLAAHGVIPCLGGCDMVILACWCWCWT